MKANLMSYKEGFAAGYAAGFTDGHQHGIGRPYTDPPTDQLRMQAARSQRMPKKRKQSGKQKILTQMAKKAWDKYKKGNGKKSYIDIRAQVSRSQAYKKRTRGM